MEFEIFKNRRLGTVRLSIEYGYEAVEAWFNDELFEADSLLQQLKQALAKGASQVSHIQGKAFSLFIMEGEVTIVHHQLLTEELLSELLGESASIFATHCEQLDIPDEALVLDEESLLASCGFEDFMSVFNGWLQEV